MNLVCPDLQNALGGPGGTFTLIRYVSCMFCKSKRDRITLLEGFPLEEKCQLLLYLKKIGYNMLYKKKNPGLRVRVSSRDP